MPNSIPNKSAADTEAVLKDFAEARRAWRSDRYRPQYHFVDPIGGLNDPNGLCYWQGRWHLFYQAYPPANPVPHWGHAVSDDLIHWRDLPIAIAPDAEHSCWSGSTLVEDDRVIAIYYAHPLGIMTATASDPLLQKWSKLAPKAVIPAIGSIFEAATGQETTTGLSGPVPVPAGAVNFVYDPCIWKKGDTYYALSGGSLPHPASGKRLRNTFLFSSTDLKNWHYLHPFIEGDIFGLPGDDGACPYFWPLGDRHILLHFSHSSGAHYLLGDYDTTHDKFLVSAGGRFAFGPASPGGPVAPSAAPDGQGNVIAIFNIFHGRHTPKWNQLMSLPRKLGLTADGGLSVEPVAAIASLRQQRQRIAATTLPANKELVLNGMGGDTVEIALEIAPQAAQMIEINVLRAPHKEEYTRITFFKNRGLVNWDISDGWKRYTEARDSLLVLDTSVSSELADANSRAPDVAPFYLAPDEKLQLRIFIDRSVIEIFANGRQSIMSRVYPARPDSHGISIRAQGGEAILTHYEQWRLDTIY